MRKDTGRRGEEHGRWMVRSNSEFDPSATPVLDFLPVSGTNTPKPPLSRRPCVICDVIRPPAPANAHVYFRVWPLFSAPLPLGFLSQSIVWHPCVKRPHKFHRPALSHFSLREILPRHPSYNLAMTCSTLPPFCARPSIGTPTIPQPPPSLCRGHTTTVANNADSKPPHNRSAASPRLPCYCRTTVASPRKSPQTLYLANLRVLMFALSSPPPISALISPRHTPNGGT